MASLTEGSFSIVGLNEGESASIFGFFFSFIQMHKLVSTFF